MVKLLKVVRNPLTNNVINVKLGGITVYRRGYDKNHKGENENAITKYLFTSKGKRNRASVYWSDYDVKCPSCGHKGKVHADDTTIIYCPHCKESFKLGDASRDLEFSSPLVKKLYLKTKENVSKKKPEPLSELDKIIIKKEENAKSILCMPQMDYWNKPMEKTVSSIVGKSEADAVNAAVEFGHRLRMNETLGINFKEAARRNKEELDKEIMNNLNC